MEANVRTDSQRRTLFPAVKVAPRLGTIVWDNGADLDQDVLSEGLTPAWVEAEKTGGRHEARFPTFGRLDR